MGASGAAVKIVLSPVVLQGLTAADQAGRHSSHIFLTSLTLRLGLTSQRHPPFHQQAPGISLGSFCSFSLPATVYVILC